MASEKLHELLDQHDIAYERHTHERVVTAQRLAAAEHVSGWEVAKPVLLSISGELAMVVVPAAAEVDLDKRTKLLGHNEVRLATEGQPTMRRVTGAEPTMWGGSIIGFGRQPYTTSVGRERDNTNFHWLGAVVEAVAGQLLRTVFDETPGLA